MFALSVIVCEIFSRNVNDLHIVLLPACPLTHLPALAPLAPQSTTVSTYSLDTTERVHVAWRALLRMRWLIKTTITSIFRMTKKQSRVKQLITTGRSRTKSSIDAGCFEEPLHHNREWAKVKCKYENRKATCQYKSKANIELSLWWQKYYLLYLLKFARIHRILKFRKFLDGLKLINCL